MKNRKRNRKFGFDYSSNNLYFVTICVHNRICCFGEVISIRNNIGTIRELSVRDSIPEFRIKSEKNPMREKMKLNKYGKIADERLLWLEEQYSYVVLHSSIVMPNHIHAIIEIDSNLEKDEKVKIKSLSELMGAFKTTSSKLIHLAGNSMFKWQRSFHDHIIKDDRAYKNISNYIDTNADRWNDDKFYK